jgi:hypothetical protein
MSEVSDRAFLFDHFPLMEYVKEIRASEGYYDLERIMKGLQGKLLDKNGNPLDPVNYVKSTLNVMKVGCMIAFKFDGKILIGYSQWDDKIDEYDPMTMFDIALQRAYALSRRRPKVIPFRIADSLAKFLNRAKAYYKNATLIDWSQDFLADPKPFLTRGGPQYNEIDSPNLDKASESFFNEPKGLNLSLMNSENSLNCQFNEIFEDFVNANIMATDCNRKCNKEVDKERIPERCQCGCKNWSPLIL